jgi:Flp pilus assembly protein TadD
MYREASHRADERGDTDGAVNLGLLLYERGDLEGAEAASRRTDERGNAAAAHNLGLLLKQRRDLEGADAACRRADELEASNPAQWHNRHLERRLGYKE